jgi:DNA repair protein RadC
MVDMTRLEQEHLGVLNLDAKNRLAGEEALCISNVNTTVVRISKVLCSAIQKNSPVPPFV